MRGADLREWLKRLLLFPLNATRFLSGNIGQAGNLCWLASLAQRRDQDQLAVFVPIAMGWELLNDLRGAHGQRAQNVASLC